MGMNTTVTYRNTQLCNDYTQKLKLFHCLQYIKYLFWQPFSVFIIYRHYTDVSSIFYFLSKDVAILLYNTKKKFFTIKNIPYQFPEFCRKEFHFPNFINNNYRFVLHGIFQGWDGNLLEGIQIDPIFTDLIIAIAIYMGHNTFPSIQGNNPETHASWTGAWVSGLLPWMEGKVLWPM